MLAWCRPHPPPLLGTIGVVSYQLVAGDAQNSLSTISTEEWVAMMLID